MVKQPAQFGKPVYLRQNDAVKRERFRRIHGFEQLHAETAQRFAGCESFEGHARILLKDFRAGLLYQPREKRFLALEVPVQRHLRNGGAVCDCIHARTTEAMRHENRPGAVENSALLVGGILFTTGQRIESQLTGRNHIGTIPYSIGI